MEDNNEPSVRESVESGPLDSKSAFRELKFDKVTYTISRLQKRISERLPDSGLSGVCAELLQASQEAEDEIKYLSRPNIWVRFGVVSVLALFAITFVYTLTFVEWRLTKPSLVDLIQISEALINDIVLLGAALFFLITIEVRLKRRKVLTALHQLRSIAHVVDMHQLTKDPSMLQPLEKGTLSSPQRTMSRFGLQRYLDYCSEMFSLVGKIAALYSEKLPEPEIVSAASDIESLCTGLSRKVWQKMVFLDVVESSKRLEG